MGLSLWIVPNEDDAKKLESITTVRQSGQRSTVDPASYPKFYPHITLASLPLSMESELDKVDASIQSYERPVKCNFSSVDIGSHYFRSVYVAIKLDTEIANLHRHIHETLGVEPRTPSFPHMSLCYIGDADAANGEKERFHAELISTGKLGIGHNDSGNISLNCGIEGKEEYVDHFMGYQVWTVRCEGPVEGWAVLKRSPLK